MRLFFILIHLPNIPAWPWSRTADFESSDDVQIEIFTHLGRDSSLEDDICIARRGLDEAQMLASWKAFINRMKTLVDQERSERVSFVDRQPASQRSLAEAAVLNPEQPKFIKRLSRLPANQRPVAARTIIKACESRRRRPLDRSRVGPDNFVREIFGRLTFDQALRQQVCSHLGNNSYYSLLQGREEFIQLLRQGLLFFDPQDMNSLSTAAVAISNFCTTWRRHDIP